MTKRDLTKKNLDDTNLSGTNLDDADLSQASLRRTKLTGASLRNAKLRDSDLHGAQLGQADLTGADLSNADLTDANLHGVDLDRAATTDGVQLTGAKGNDRVESAGVSPDREREHIAHAVREIAALNDAIASLAGGAFAPQPDQPGEESWSAEMSRRTTADRIDALRLQRNAMEDRLISLIDERTIRP